MSFNLVRQGENFHPSAAMHNATARMLNSRGRIGEGEFKGRSMGGTSYDGPFAVKFDSENEQRIVVNSGLVICGQYTLTVPVSNFPFVNGYIIGKITYNGSYHVDVLQTTDYRQGYDYAVFRIADIQEGTITQIQYGDFFVAGRVV